jgi:hypothetical protein
MRTVEVLTGVAAGLLAGAATQVGCFNYAGDCTYTLTCCPDGAPSCGGGGTSNGGTGGSGGQSGSHLGSESRGTTTSRTTHESTSRTTSETTSRTTTRTNGEPEAGADSGNDAGHDAASDAESDARFDAGLDAESEAGFDAGFDAGPPPSCIPNLNHGNPIAATCGVFVSNTASSYGTGTQSAPFASITAALGAGATPVYVCSGTAGIPGTRYSEAVTVPANVTIYGGLDCATWAYNAAVPTQLTAPVNAVPMTFVGGTVDAGSLGSAVYDFAITASDATTPGGSSIALFDNGVTLTLERVAIAAGPGAGGANGALPSPAQVQMAVYSDGGVPMNGGNGQPAPASCSSQNTPAGIGGMNMCRIGLLTANADAGTSGGYGGEGYAGGTSDQGNAGQPYGDGGAIELSPAPGGGGAGWSNGQCGSGEPGAEFYGVLGVPGTGASGFGYIDAAGYHGPVATPGGFGPPGQGGGGGGGALATGSAPNYCAGPSGGGGGAGGCGGEPGNPGQTGGSSIGIVAYGANLTLANVTIQTSAGGNGGNGAAGQQGGLGGLPGSAVAVGACAGGNGGTGGIGGYGPGGAGGNSVGIAMSGGSLTMAPSTSIVPANGTVPGGAGSDGSATSGTQGAAGGACKTLTFTGGDGGATCGD